MRILQLAPPWFPVPPRAYGGIEQVVSLLTEGLVAAGHEVTLLAATGSKTTARLWSSGGRDDRALLGDPHLDLAHALAGYRRRDEFDVIHDHTSVGAALGALPGGPPVVHTMHGPFTPSTGRFYRAVGEHVELVAISADQASRRPPGLRLAGVVHNAVAVAALPLLTRRSRDLVFIGRASPDKGPDVAIEVARRLGRRLRMAVKVNEPDEQAYFADVLAPLLGRGDVDVELVTVTTPAQKWQLLAGASVLLFPIRWDEPFGLVPAEANACGTPVVAYARGAVPEVVADGESGVLVPAGDLDGLCAAVAAAERLDASNCRRHAARRFGVGRMVEGYLSVYARAVSAPVPQAG